MPTTPGQILNNRYRIDRLLGQGGYGAVYHAWDSNLDGPVAVKESFETSPAAQKQFQLEARLLFKLHHNHLPRVYDYFVIPDQGLYLVMDYIDGEDLEAMLQRGGAPLPEAQVLEWAGQICDALAYLHAEDPPVIHRDIKPANIRITPQGSAMLVDFGIAKVFGEQLKTSTGARAVTPGYSPYEQYLSSGRTDARSDVYALGSTLYTLLTGQVPPEALERNIGAALAPPRALNPAITPGVEAAILKAMQLRPEDRFHNMDELHRALSAPAGAAPRETKSAAPASRPAVSVNKNAPAAEAALRETKAAAPASRPAPAGIKAAVAPRVAQSRLWMWLAAAGAALIFAIAALLSGVLWINQEDTSTPPPGQTEPAAEVAQIATETRLPTLHPTDTPVALGSPTPPHTAVSTDPPAAATPITGGQILAIEFCDKPCQEPDAKRSDHFPQGTLKVYAAFKYQGMQPGTRYTRIWSMDGAEWVRYDCEWQGPQDGVYYLQLWDLHGLSSGAWMVSIQIEGQPPFVDAVTIDGSFKNWQPNGLLPCGDW